MTIKEMLAKLGLEVTPENIEIAQTMIDGEVSGLKNKNNDLIAQNKKAKQLEEMGFSVEEVEKMMKDNTKADYMKAVSEGRLDEFLQSIENKGYEKGKSESTEAFENSQKQLNEYQEKLTKTESSWNEQIKRNRLTEIVSKMPNVNPSQVNDAVDMLMLKYNDKFEVVDGDNGRDLYTTDKSNNAENKPKTAADTALELSQNHGWMFTGQTGTDTGGSQEVGQKGEVLDDIDNASEDDIMKEFGL